MPNVRRTLHLIVSAHSKPHAAVSAGAQGRLHYQDKSNVLVNDADRPKASATSTH